MIAQTKAFFHLTVRLTLWYKMTSFQRQKEVTVATQKKSKRTKSGLKRQRQSEKLHERNRSLKSMLKTLAKKVEQAVDAKNADTAKESLVSAMKAYHKAVSQGILHKNTASRKISRLSTKVRSLTAA